MIKIISGWGNCGGSTVAFINLTNALNKRGIETVFYTPHQWPLDKCKADTMANVTLREDDSLIIHFFKTNWAYRPPTKGKVIYSCHEKDICPMSNLNYKIFDKIHFVSRPQKEWHNIDHPSFILPNIVNELKPSKAVINGFDRVGGIIGSIDRNKQTNLSIERAIEDGMKKILLFGNISDLTYYNEILAEEKFKDKRIIHMGHEDDKQKMYDSITDVYLSSKSETWSFIPKECDLTGVCFHGTDAIKDNFEQNMTNDEIVKHWCKELKI